MPGRAPQRIESGCCGERCARRGFSLVEVVIVVVLVLALATLVLPELSGFSESVEFRETGDQVASVLSMCRAEAQRRGVPLELRMANLDEGSVGLVMRPVRLGGGESEDVPPGEVMMRMPDGYSVGDDLTSEEGETGTPIEGDPRGQLVGVFWPNGSVSAAVMQVISGNRRAEVRISAYTGHVEVREVAMQPGDAESDAQPEEEEVEPESEVAPPKAEPDAESESGE
jgi:prepilin-type N-terminal cleavage/methylation domain-containing protein